MSLIRKAYNKSRYKKAAMRYCNRIFRQFGPLQSEFTKKLFEEKLEEVKMIAQKLASVPVPSYKMERMNAKVDMVEAVRFKDCARAENAL